MSPLQPLDYEDLDPQLREMFRPRVERLGYLGDWFRFTAHQPDALRHFYAFTESLKTNLPEDLIETVALTAASQLGNQYERHQHEQLSRKLGFSDSWIRLLATGGDDSELTEPQRRVRALTEAIVTRSGEAPERLDQVVALVGEQTGIGVLLLAARYVAHAAVTSALALQPPVPSIFEGDGDANS